MHLSEERETNDGYADDHRVPHLFDLSLKIIDRKVNMKMSNEIIIDKEKAGLSE